MSCKTVADLAVVGAKAGREVEGVVEVVVEPATGRVADVDPGIEIQWDTDRAIVLERVVTAAEVAEAEAEVADTGDVDAVAVGAE